MHQKLRFLSQFLPVLFVATSLAITRDVDAAGKRYALIVGVSTYRAGQPLPELAYAENDADELAKVLTDGGYNVTLMTQTVGRNKGSELLVPMSDFIRDQLVALLDNPFLKPEDIVIVALAGHGVQYELVEGDKTTPTFYFCPADADVAKLKTANDVTDRSRLLDLSEVYKALSDCKAGGKLLLVDACRNDPSKPSVSRSLASSTLPPLPPPPGGTAAFFSCSAHQQAFEDKDLKHGVFFHHVIEALKGDADVGNAKRPADGQITLAELSESVSATTYDYVRTKFKGARQAPELKGEFRISIPILTISRFQGKTAGDRKELVPGIAFRWCPAGTFTMGSPNERNFENAVSVTLSNGYWLQETEVTQGQFTKVMDTAPWKGQEFVKEGDDYAASYLSHVEAVQYCEALTLQEREAGRMPRQWRYSLPTEAQWEYGCRAGTKTEYSFGDDLSQLDEYGWWGAVLGDGNAKGNLFAQRVGLKKPNGWGLRDMHGNVWEWCGDWHRKIVVGGVDPKGPSSGERRVFKGGAWQYHGYRCRSASRASEIKVYQSVGIGFRIAAVPE